MMMNIWNGVLPADLRNRTVMEAESCSCFEMKRPMEATNSLRGRLVNQDVAMSKIRPCEMKSAAENNPPPNNTSDVHVIDVVDDAGEVQFPTRDERRTGGSKGCTSTPRGSDCDNIGHGRH